MHETLEESQPEMAREIVNLLRPRYVILFLIGSLFVFLVFSSFSQQEEDTVDEVYEITHRVFLDVDVDKQRLGRIVIGLYGEVVPKTVENFRALCTGELGKNKSGKLLHYKGTPFHRIIPGFMIQGGDIVHGDGHGNESIYGGTFRDENFKIKQSHPGMVAMVNSGPDSNGSQFFITTVKAYWLDGEHVVFGKVIEGMDNVYVIEGSAGTYSGKPRKKVVISDSGEIPKSEWNVETRSTTSES
ncbi:putative peptidylprolyl isomerase [Helianthus annuus]|uniref:Peptidyl-prolyl cis-trans isomerase n=1 Tax=Helianthus annuus TaxID=4232 RepID=A0A251RQJ0_HELAN|nr:peptidyl-prolyl cis-trans isomerase CYP21-1 [Helianthus annuus]KAF5755721.1 putative peptidylprolyl isomerase [Helianthus annuus]KAJ0429343.1 putative peptidylprolyl isomerase [Helianthus annuus]KAJ0433727.1 putative peptidylprolyl isomerase [Helianthus annuus]KAJ0447701.1 putative peptidylprolyl isomerase [Helianthus annuus]KAJ0632602.1 putative peptidylprolyl isomerase [Helianthus annuus]